MHARLIETVTGATGSASVDESADRTSQRILDAALAEATAVGLDRITVEDVVRRAGVSRMTAYRRYPRRDDLVEALCNARRSGSSPRWPMPSRRSTTRTTVWPKRSSPP